MFSNRTPFLFPHTSVPFVREMREESSWAELVDWVATLPETHEDSLAFQLMMIRICGCLRCTNYKANLGCTVCSQRAVRNSKSSTASMMGWYSKAREEVDEFMSTQNIIPLEAIERAA
jgi:hypothetical protein